MIAWQSAPAALQMRVEHGRSCSALYLFSWPRQYRTGQPIDGFNTLVADDLVATVLQSRRNPLPPPVLRIVLRELRPRQDSCQ